MDIALGRRVDADAGRLIVSDPTPQGIDLIVSILRKSCGVGEIMTAPPAGLWNLPNGVTKFARGL